MIRYVFAVLAIVGVFVFPWGFTLFLTAVAAYFLPPVAILVGVLYDAFYYAPGAAFMPTATLIGIALAIAAYFIRRFVHSRISDFS